MAPSVGSRSCSATAAAGAFITCFRDVPYLLEDLDAEALVVRVVARKVAVVFAFGIGAGAAEDELLPVAHIGLKLVGACELCCL